VFVTSFEEEGSVEACLRSVLRSAEVAASRAELHAVRVVLADSASQDRTAAIARELGVEVLECPRGKLSARDHAYRRSQADLILAADADRAYPEGWVGGLVEGLLRDPEGVAVTGETGSEAEPFGGTTLLRRWLQLPFNGGNSAFFRQAYLSAPHDLELDEFRHRELWAEEEFRFCLRLKHLGRVRFVPLSSAELRPYPLARVLLRHLFGVRLGSF